MVFPDDKLIVVSNREPYTIKGGKGDKAERTVGGLVSSLDTIMQKSHGVWIASGKMREGGKGVRIRYDVPLEDPSYTLRIVPLSKDHIEGYYNGYANRLLWPMCHITLDRIHLEGFYWPTYREVNRMFADTVVDEAGDSGAMVWLHDYHLALCAGMIKEKRPDIKTSLFWHIPWPPHGVLRVCPQRKEILEGLLSNDLLGFQLDYFKKNFMDCVEAELDAEVDAREGSILYKGRTTRVKAFPISVDFEWFEKAASGDDARNFIDGFLKQRGLEGLKLGLAVDRLDYTKGFIKCLEALDLFFEKYPQFMEKFTFIHVAVSTRKMEPYISYTEQVRAKVEAINKKYSKGSWRPVEYIDRKLTQKELASLYRYSDIAMISSVYDGMNLVAKEYVASQVDLNGTLLLSELAGSAGDIPGAVLINPYDTDGYADAIKDALEKDPEKKKQALLMARAHVRKNDIYRWVEDILEELKGIR